MTPSHEDLATLLFARADPGAEVRAAVAMAASVARTLRMAMALATAGRTIDLGGLDNWVGRLVARSLDLDPPEGRTLRPVLWALLGDLERLERIVRAGGGELGSA